MAVARESRLIVGHSVLKERTWEEMQILVEALPHAQLYCSDEIEKDHHVPESLKMREQYRVPERNQPVEKPRSPGNRGISTSS